MSKRIFIIVGEASGDLHASNLVKAIKSTQPSWTFDGWGGDLMEEAGVRVLKHYRDLAFMGFAEVIANLRTIKKNFRLCKQQIQDLQPDLVIMVDYPGFNLRLASFVHELNIPIYYYISPQIWAWKESRINTIKKFISRMYVILPFEQDFYARHNFEVEFVGHPLLDVIESREQEDDEFDRFVNQNNLDQRPIIALLPGSRQQEIKRILPIMASSVANFPEYQFVVAGAPSMPAEFYTLLGDGLKVVSGQTYNLFKHSKAALVTSGTATLEAALHDLPQVVCYKGGTLSYLIAKQLIKVKYISLVNLIADKEIVKELIQNELNVKSIKTELARILNDDHRNQVLTDYTQLKTLLGGPGASQRAAQSMIKALLENL